MLLTLEKTNDFDRMVAKIVDDVALVQAAMMTGVKLTDRQQGPVAQRVITRPDTGLLPTRAEALSSASDVALEGENATVMDERRDPADTLPRPAERVIYNLHLDPHCPRRKDEPRSQCPHAGR